MSVMIENTDELLALLKKMDLKVHSVDELHQLLTSINASYNPEAARLKTAKLIGTAVPGSMAGAAAFGSFMLLASGSGAFAVGGLAVIWGAVAIVSTAAVIAAAILSGGSRGRSLADNPPVRPASRSEPIVTHITRELPT